MGDKQVSIKVDVRGDAKKSPYSPPSLKVYGSVSKLTQNGAGSGADGGVTAGMTMVSDRQAKENVVRVGTHFLGIGLYLYDHKPEYRKTWGDGRRFGVMADEVERVMPNAVSAHPDGYKTVNYDLLGISRPPR